jgi:tRNA 5-methylaminomethyl-2-thiouridine biosynthesis bifunctional protein
VRGQITVIAANDVSRALKTNLHYGGYVSPEIGGVHYCGATFQPWLSHVDLLDEDNLYNLNALQSALPSLSGAYDIVGARAAVRCASKDRFPIIGPVGQAGHYLSCAHGSHGIISAISGAHLLADELRGGIKSLSSGTRAALSSARFNKI